MPNKTKILGIGVGIFVIFVIVGITYESSTGLNMISGEKKTSGVGADKWTQESPKPSESNTEAISQAKPSQNNCDSSYPSVCISPYSPDLDCDEISYSNFRVLQPDPHGFDRDKDGIGCEK